MPRARARDSRLLPAAAPSWSRAGESKLKISTIRYTIWMDSETATAGALLRQARKRARLSQVELAARAGVTQSVISAYESGHRQPAIPALAALVDAAGYELAMGLRRRPRRLGRLSGPVGRRGRRPPTPLVAAPPPPAVPNFPVARTRPPPPSP